MLSLLAESWTWYAFGTLIVSARYVSRWLQLGSLKAFQLEDYIMVVVFAFYTNLIVWMNVVAHLDTNLMLPSDIPLLTPASIASRIHGSKLVLVVEQSMITTQWGCKICLLLLYNKLTFGLRQQLAVKVVGVYVVVNWIIMESLYFGVWCRPFDQYWAVPTDNEQCSAAIHHLITNAVFNISSDLMMLCIPIPILISSQLPRANKFILCILFGLGVFVILCAVLNKYYSFAHPFSPMWEFWYVREASTAIYVANMPMCWGLMRRLFKLRAFNGLTSSNGARSRSKSVPIASTYVGASMASRTGMKGKPQVGTMTSHAGNPGRGGGNASWWEREAAGLTRSESEEYIVADPKKDVPLEIWESRQVDIDRGSVRDDSELGLSRGVGVVKSPTKMYDGSGRDYQTTTMVTARVSSPPGQRDSGSR